MKSTRIALGEVPGKYLKIQGTYQKKTRNVLEEKKYSHHTKRVNNKKMGCTGKVSRTYWESTEKALK